MLETVSIFVTVIVETLLVCPLLVAVTFPEPPAHLGIEFPVTYPLELTVTLPVEPQVVVVPQQLVLQATVLESLKVAVALSWAVPNSTMLALEGDMDIEDTMLVFIKAMVKL
jgi:hypothetical protein